MLVVKAICFRFWLSNAKNILRLNYLKNAFTLKLNQNTLNLSRKRVAVFKK